MLWTGKVALALESHLDHAAASGTFNLQITEQFLRFCQLALHLLSLAHDVLDVHRVSILLVPVVRSPGIINGSIIKIYVLIGGRIENLVNRPQIIFI